MEQPSIKVYLDANVLEYWYKYSLKPQRKKKTPPPYAEPSLSLLRNLHTLSCHFVTSDLTFAEIARIRSKYARRRLRRPWDLVLHSQRIQAIKADLRSIRTWINTIGIEVLELKLNERLLDDIMMLFGIHTLDALHVGLALDSQCTYFVTADKRLKKKLRDGFPDRITIVDPLVLIEKLRKSKRSA